MANLLDQVGTSVGDFSWASIGQIGLVITIFFGALIIIGGVLLLMWWKSFYIKVRVYEPYGQIDLSPEEEAYILAKSKDKDYDYMNDKKIQFDMIRIKSTHGKYITYKGAPSFHTFMPFRKHEPIPIELMFNDGIHLLRLSREVFIPIPKPKTIINVGENVSLTVQDNNKWQTWNNMMADRINNKYQDIDAQKKAITYFVIGIVAMVLIGGFILWLIYSSANKGLEAADKLNMVADSLIGGGNTPS